MKIKLLPNAKLYDTELTCSGSVAGLGLAVGGGNQTTLGFSFLVAFTSTYEMHCCLIVPDFFI